MKNQIVAMGVLKSLAALLLCLSALPVMAGYNMPVNRLPVAVVNPMAESSYRSVVSVSAGNLSGTVFSESYYSQPIWNNGNRADRVNTPISGQAMYSVKRMNTGNFTPVSSPVVSRYGAGVTGFQAISAVPRLNDGTIAPVLPFGENGGLSRRGITNPPDPDENDPNDPMGGNPNGPVGDALWFLLALAAGYGIYRRCKTLRL
ncbi:MAG: hypothetical protein ACI3Z5_01910 [Paludibacteraceae bacterium]